MLFRNTVLWTTSYWQFHECHISWFEFIFSFLCLFLNRRKFLLSNHVIKPRTNELAVEYYIATYGIIYLLKRQLVVIQLPEAVIHDYTRQQPLTNRVSLGLDPISISLAILWNFNVDIVSCDESSIRPPVMLYNMAMFWFCSHISTHISW